MKTHQKIQDLKLRAAPITMSGSYVDKEGNLQIVDLKVDVVEADRTVKGYLIVWGVKDTFDTIFVKGCCSRSIKDRGPKSDAKQKIAHLWQHEIDNPTGQFTVLKEDDYGLYFEAILDDIPIGERELKQIRSGTLNQFSVGFNYIWDKVEYDENADAVLLYEIELMEGSVVTFGSNAETYAMRSPEQVIQEKENLIDDTEDFIKSLPRSRQLELRQLIKRHISIASLKPDVNPLKPNEGKEFISVGEYKLNLNEF